MDKKSTKALVAKIRKHYKLASDADRKNRRDGLDDLKFVNVPGEQWDDAMRKERGERPCYEFNKLRVTCKRIVNDMRANRPAGKVRAVEGGDKQTAEVYEGLIRNIWNTSDGDTVIDYEAEYQVEAGMGAWRVASEYSSDTSFEQSLVIRAIPNPMCLYADPSAKDLLRRDASYWILTERITKAAYQARWPKAEVLEFDDEEFDDNDEWEDEDRVRIAEYWYKEPKTKTLLALSDGSVIDADALTPEKAQGLTAMGITVVRQREVQTHQIMQCIFGGGDALLEGPTEWKGSQFPFVMVYGEYKVIDGRLHWWGLPRFARDAQQSYNVTRTAITETIALAPQFKWWATPEQAKGHAERWAEAHKQNFPYMLYNADPKSPGPPGRMAGADVPAALIQEAMMASEEIKAVTGIFDASLGQQGNETSGRAINARQRQGEIATFNYMDNLSKGIRRTWEILIDLIPHYYDTPRMVRVLGSDGSADYVEINGPAGTNDLAKGRYDVTVTVGPSFATQRQEAAQSYMELSQANPALMQVAGDLMFKSMDLPYADEIAERMKAILPPQVQASIGQGGKAPPPEVQAAMAQVNAAMEQVQQQGMLVQQAAEEADQKIADADKAKSEVEKAIANLATDKAQFEAFVAKQMAMIAQKEAQAAMKGAESGVSQDREALSTQVDQAVVDIQKVAGEFMQQATQTLAEIQARTQPVVVVPPKPRVVRIDSQRVDGRLVAVPVYEDQVTANG